MWADCRAVGEADPLEEAEDVELGLGAEIVEHRPVGELGDPDRHLSDQTTEFLRQARERLAREKCEVVERRGGEARPDDCGLVHQCGP